MKRIGAFSLAIIVFTLSIVLCFPYISFADDATTLSKSKDNPFGYSSSEARSYVSAHKDIYDSDHILLFSYTPTNTYNWTYSQVGKNSLHLSDNQLVAFLMSKKTITAYASMFVSVLSNNNVTRGLLSSVGIATTGDSDSLVNVMDKLTGNYNYLDSLNYDDDSKTITMSNDNGSVDKLREEIKKYYYDSIGVKYVNPSATNCNAGKLIELNHTLYDYEEDYMSDFNACNNYDYSVGTAYVSGAYHFVASIDKSKYSYAYYSSKKNINYMYFVDKDMNIVNDSAFHVFFAQKNTLEDLVYNDVSITVGYPSSSKSYMKLHLFNDTDSGFYESSWYNGYADNASRFYSKNGKPFIYFSSYENLYNFIHGSQTAYISSRIDKAGEDISFSIKDMNENLGSKMDTLIDSINSNKSNMSADELQNAIDKGLEDLNKNTEDIKDNTSSILDKLEEQNQILLQILGVTEFIAYQEVKENSDQYNMSYLKTLLDSMFTGLFNALMYGENTVDDKNTDTASMQSFSVSNAAAPVAVYSDDIAVYDSSGSGGCSSFGGGSDSSGGHFFDLKNGLFGKFPFSIPYQCYNWLQILQRDPEAPTFTLDYGYLFGCSGDPKFVLSFDLSRYNDIAEVGRSFCRLFMTLMLALGIYHKNKGEM